MQYDLILVDGSSYLFRAYHALPPLVNADGVPTGAIFGVLNMLKRLEKDYPGTKVIVVFDPKGGSFRQELYTQYKSDRVETPDDLQVQIPLLQEVVVALGYPLLIEQNYEADDVIATLVKMAGDKRVLISTLDKDLAQLVTDNVHIINTMHNKLLDVEKVIEKFGVRPDQIRDYLALVGDRSDCVPGITGVGPKTAAKWLSLYDSIDGIKENKHLLGGKVGENFCREMGQVDLSYQLVTLVENIDLGNDIDAIVGMPRDTERLKEYFKRLGFNRWLAEVSEQKVGSAIALRSNNAVKMIISLLRSCEYVVVAYEVSKTHNALKPLEQIVLYVDGKSYFIDSDKVDMTQFWQDVIEEMGDKTVVAYDVKILLNDLVLRGIDVSLLQWFDIMLAGYVIDSVNASPIDKLMHRYSDQVVLLKKEDVVAERLTKQATNIHTVYPVLQASVAKDTCSSLYHGLEMPLMKLLAKMEQYGVLVDVAFLTTYAERLLTEIKATEETVYQLVGKQFNLSSPKQLGEILFEELGLPVIEKTPGGVASTAESVLHALEPQHPVIALLLKYRTLSKIYSTYADALPRQVMVDQRIHGCFNQAITVTGRLSSMNPNLQNIPIRTEYGRRIRQGFIAPKGYTLVAADYSQVELRIMAHISEDPGLLKAFAEGDDIHAITAAKVEGIPLEQVSSDQRRRAKAVNFGLIYGMSAFGLAKQLGVERAQAQQLIDRYFSEYPGVLSYMEKTRQQAVERGYVETLWGRKMLMVGAKSNNGIEKQAAMRAAINAPMQGTAADIIKQAMIDVDKTLTDFDYHMILQVHDELLFEVRNDQVEAFKAAVLAPMENVVSLKVPLIVNVSSGGDWDSAH